MENSKPKKNQYLPMIIGLIVLVIMIGGVTYSFFNYTRTGSVNTIMVGNIEFSSSHESITLENLFPIASSSLENASEGVGEVVVTINGKTSYEAGIEYLVSFTNVQNTINGKELPISLTIDVDGLGASDDSYFENHGENKTYKVLAGEQFATDEKVVVGFIPAGDDTTQGTITMKVYIDKDKIAISDTFDGEASDYNGTTSEWAGDRVILTTEEWNSMQQSGVSFKIKVEANLGTWVDEPIKFIDVLSQSEYANNYSTTVLANNSTFKTQDTVSVRNQSEKQTVYYYSGNDGKNNGNVLFAGYCWQFVRTTDDGGIRLLYNGVAENNQCTTSRSVENQKGVNSSSASVDLSSAYLYGTSYNYDLETGKFELVNKDANTSTWSLATYKDYIGKYTCLNTTGTNCNYVYYVAQYDPSDSTKAYTTKYSIGNLTNYSQMGISSFNAGYTMLSNVGYKYNDTYVWKNGSAQSGYIYGRDVEYDGSNYLVIDTEPGVASQYTTIYSTRHYTCGSASVSSCSTVRYYYYNNYYIELSNGETIETVLKNMINYKSSGEKSADINVISSTIKDYLEIWYDKNLKDYEIYLDKDAVYCNNRSIRSLAGWNKDGGLLNGELLFKDSEYNLDLSCENITDRFSISNRKAKLNSSIGLLTDVERNLMGSTYAQTNNNYWTMSPNSFYYYDAYLRVVTTNGESDNHYVGNNNAVRGVITLRPEVELENGDGTDTNPYQIGPLVNRIVTEENQGH